MKAKVNKVSIQTLAADIWSVPVAGVVHATDTDLTLPAHILTRTGAVVERELAHIGYCPVGQAVITGAGALPFEKIIHAVGPRWGEGSERGKLAGVVFECLRLAEANGLKSLALPAISTGALGYPLENCATTTLSTVIDYTFEDLKHLRRIVIGLDNDLALEAFDRELLRQLQELGAEGEGQAAV
jgi:O-acetyl-ADP-ribose deacetylase (regulator of RNase III)